MVETYSESKAMKRHWPTMSSHARRTLSELQHYIGLFNAVYNTVAFFMVLLLLPCILSIYIGISLLRYVALRLLSKVYADLEFVQSTSVRTTVDTVRNQGIITLVLQVKGTCDLQMFKSRLQSDMLNRMKCGRLVFPHLRTKLTSVWGWYAWVKTSATYFNINNHVVLAAPIPQGGVGYINDANMQKFISERVSKYLCPDNPPWQITIIPSPDKYYVLIRLHHLYLSVEHLGLGDLLLLEPDSHSWSSEDVEDYLDNDHLLAGTFKTPVAIPQVYQHVYESFCNFWNEFLSVYDPQENPKILKSATLRTYFSITLITAVSIIREYVKCAHPNLTQIIRREMNKRYFTVRLFWVSVLNTFHPVTIATSIASWTWWFTMTLLLQAFRTVLNIPVYTYWMILLYHVLRELWYLTNIVYTAPRMILQELFFPAAPNSCHHLQTVSLCGRKAISWSDPVSLDYIRRIHDATGASSCEILLSAVSASVRDYFRYLGFPVPDSVVTTARFVPQEYLLAQSSSFQEHGGLMCLELPLWIPDEPIENLTVTQNALYKARTNQASIYLASLYRFDHSLLPKLLPSVLARILLNALSRKYAVTITQVDATTSERKRRRLLWGQEVENIMYWRPPQGNISLSMTLMSYGDSVRLCIMSDTQLSPQHSIISNNFDKHIGQLAVAAGVARRPGSPSRSSTTSPASSSPTGSASHSPMGSASRSPTTSISSS